jgi:AbrB family looped-hinge helix DNA binding protein
MKGAIMTVATVTSKGQITIPASVRVALGISAGSRVEFVEVGKGQYMLVPAVHSVGALKGLLRKPMKPVTIEAMNEAIAVQGAQAK